MTDDKKTIRKKIDCNGEEFEVIYRKLRPRPAPGELVAAALAEGRQPIFMRDGFGDCPELNPRTYEVCPGIICDQDVMIPMRDGCKTYCDIYRPAGMDNVPVIISFSFYGKRPCCDNPSFEYGTIGVPQGSHSQHAKFEGPDPEYWCHKGYAIANYDPRGVCNSEGDIYMCTSQEGRDAYDLIEFLAELTWCNGKVGMSGNSGLAVCQWKAASENPPHLACIAPWEGLTDTYRHLINMGGITECGFNPLLTSMIFGEGYMEDYYLMSLEHPLYNNYWKDKVSDLTKIDVPAYITGGWNHFHLHGALDAFARISAKEKWLRIHRDFEWPDLYDRDSLEDLTKFFDRYLKGIRNGWESTPRVRIDVMDAYDRDHAVKRPAADFPLPGTEYKKLWLDASDNLLKAELPTAEAKTSYDGNTGRAVFDITVDRETEIIGHMKLHLWVEADGNDDMDLFIAVKKMDADGRWIPTYILGKPHPGSPGRLRVSLRELDPERSTEYQPYPTYNNPQKLKAGEIVPVEIEIWATSRIWHTGEQIRLEVMGRYERFDWFEPFNFHTNNKGNHVIHTGGKHDSFLLIPYQVYTPEY